MRGRWVKGVIWFFTSTINTFLPLPIPFPPCMLPSGHIYCIIYLFLPMMSRNYSLIAPWVLHFPFSLSFSLPIHTFIHLKKKKQLIEMKPFAYFNAQKVGSNSVVYQTQEEQTLQVEHTFLLFSHMQYESKYTIVDHCRLIRSCSWANRRDIPSMLYERIY